MGMTLRLPEWLVDCRTLFGEHARPVFGDVHAIFEAYAELAVDGDGRLVAETHPGLDFGFVALHEVGPLVPFESDAVPRAMRQAGDFVPWAEARVGNDFACGRVDGFARSARFGGGERGVLRFALEVPHFLLALGGLT